MDVTARLNAAVDALDVQTVTPLGGGACQDNFRVEATLEGQPITLALRSDAASSLPGSIGRAEEFPIIAAAVAQGVPTPQARWLTEGVVRDGAHAYLLDWVDGEAIGSRVVKHPTLERARQLLPDQLAEALAGIHRIDPQNAELLLAPVPDLDPAAMTIAFLRKMRDELPEKRPGFELALLWASENQPEPQEITLVHGDFRTGNFMVGPEGLVAVLDWEFAHWGDPMDDLGWLCTRDWRFGKTKLPAGGVATRVRFYDAYQKASGRVVDPERVHFWEIIGNLRWGAAAVFQGERYLSGTSQDLELLAIPRRAAEMEYEALRLIELGPPWELEEPPLAAPESGRKPSERRQASPTDVRLEEDLPDTELG
ncbi:MAG: phosphotransferase [Proteobacteria bacterium]|nr:phosphotransferase [Pseudomonadota bacterium]MCP4915880.1 phosphotransferase [Pseudomonadota bacterium]